jgi:uncharacterized membrane protein YbhN (UPF0104 family)
MTEHVDPVAEPAAPVAFALPIVAPRVPLTETPLRDAAPPDPTVPDPLGALVAETRASAGGEATADSVTAAEAAPRSRRSRQIMTALSVIAPGAGVAWLATHSHELATAFRACERADGEWLVVAAVAACLTYLAAAVSMKGAVTRQLPFGQLIAVQVAGILPNVLVPAGMGVAALQTRYLLRRGLTMAEAVGATAVNATAGALPHGLALVILLVSGVVPLPKLGIAGQTTYLLIALGVLALVTACVPKARHLAQTGVRRIVEQRALLAGGGSTTRAILLWGGSIAIPMLHAATLCAVAAALHAPLGAGKIIPVYIVASALSAIIPSPGGFGGLDAALTALLTSAGSPTTTAIAAVLGYRLLTSWLPMAPSAAVCGVLIRSRIL